MFCEKCVCEVCIYDGRLRFDPSRLLLRRVDKVGVEADNYAVRFGAT